MFLESNAANPDFVLILGFYHNFSIRKKISCKISALLSKTRCIFIIEHYLHSHYLNEDERYILSTGWSSCQCVRTNHGFLREFFNDRLVSVGPWPPQSPDLITLNFLLRGHLKNKIFATHPATIEEMKRRRITMEIQNITQKTLQKVFQNTMCHTVTYKNLDGVHFLHML